MEGVDSCRRTPLLVHATDDDDTIYLREPLFKSINSNFGGGMWALPLENYPKFTVSLNWRPTSSCKLGMVGVEESFISRAPSQRNRKHGVFPSGVGTAVENDLWD